MDRDRQLARPLALVLLVVLLGAQARCRAGGPAGEELIRVGQPLPDLDEQTFLPLHGYPPSALEYDGRVVALLLFQAGQEGDLDVALSMLQQLETLAPPEHLLLLGVATCVDVQQDALSLDDSYINMMIDTEGHTGLRVVRDRNEQLWQRVLIHTARGYRRGTPSLVIADARGQVFATLFLTSRKRRVRAKHALQAAIALAAAPDQGIHHPRVQPAVDAYKKDELGDAFRQAEKLLDDPDSPPTVVASAAQLLGLIQLRYEAELARIEALLDRGEVNQALDLLGELRADCFGCDLADDVRDRRDTIEEDPAWQEERKADRAIGRVLRQLEDRDLTRESSRKLHAGRLRRLAERYAGTISARRALTRAQELWPQAAAPD
jgi:hypothetical protein